MKAISLKQPWASFVAIGKKTIEIRTWTTRYRGELLIVSSKTADKNYPGHNLLEVIFKIPYGQALAIAKLTDCRPMKKEDEKAAMISWHPKRYAWILEDIREIEPFPVKGQLGLYEVQYKEI